MLDLFDLLSLFEDKSDWSQLMQILLGSLICVVGAICANLGLIIQKLPASRSQLLVKIGGWVAFVLGQLVVWGSMALIPASISAILTSVSVLSNAALAPLLLHESLTWEGAGLMLAIFVGSVMAVLAPKSESEDELVDISVSTVIKMCLQPSFLIILAVMAVTIVGVQRKFRHGPEPPLTASLCCATISVLLAKCCAMILSQSLHQSSSKIQSRLVNLPGLILALLFATVAFFSIFLLNRALQRGSALYVLPIYYAGSTLCAVIAAMIFFNEYRLIATPFRTIFFITGTLIVLISTHRLSALKSRDESPTESTPMLNRPHRATSITLLPIRNNNPDVITRQVSLLGGIVV